MASVSCRCGSVVLRFASDRPRVTTECCCNHCFARVRYLAELGGPQIPSKDKPLVNSKWDNSFVVEKGRGNLFAYKMTKGTAVFNIATKCCHTFMLGRNDIYDAQCVTTCDDFPLFSGNIRLSPSSRWFSNQWSPERLSKLENPSLIGIWVNEDDNSLTGDAGWEQVYETHKAAMESAIVTQHPLGVTSETFKDLIDTVGDIKIVAAQ